MKTLIRYRGYTAEYIPVIDQWRLTEDGYELWAVAYFDGDMSESDIKDDIDFHLRRTTNG